MKSVAALVGALERGDASPAPYRVLTRVMWTIDAVILLALLFGGSLYSLWKAWQTGDWFSFQFSAFLPGMLIVFGVIVAVAALIGRTMGQGANKTQMQQSIRALRDIAALGDDRLAPPAILQPTSLAGVELPMTATRIGPLKQPALVTTNGAQLFGTIFGPLFTLVAFIPLLAVIFGEDFGSSTPLGGFFPLLYLIWFPLIFVPILLRARRGGPSVFVTADETGMSWRRPGSSGPSLQIAWDQVRSLSRIGYSGYGGSSGGYNTAADWAQRTSYMLDAADATFVWTISSVATDPEVAASELFLRLAVTRTGKSLRDLSAIAGELAQAGGNAMRVLAGRAPAGSTTPVLPNLATPSIPAQPDKRSRAKVALWVAAGLVPLLLLAGLYGAGFWLQQYQPQYYANLPAQLHTRQPLYHDDLASPTGDWPVQQPTSSDYRGFAYVNGAYQLSGNVKGNFLVALGPRQFGDAAIEVTATQTGELTQDGGDGVGIILHSNADQSEFLAFDVGYDGNWQLMHYKYVDNRASDNWHGVDYGQSSAINNAPGAVNHLLLISHGNTYWFYINGQFVSSENVRYETIPGSGYAGLYLDDTALTGTFSNFSVYPVQPVAPWEIV